MTLIIGSIVDEKLFIIGDSKVSFDGHGFEVKDQDLIRKCGVSKSIIYNQTCICFAGTIYQDGKSIIQNLRMLLLQSKDFTSLAENLLSLNEETIKNYGQDQQIEFILAKSEDKPQMICIKDGNSLKCKKCYIGNANAYNELISDSQQSIKKFKFPSIRVSYVFENTEFGFPKELTNTFSNFHKLIFRANYDDVGGYLFCIVAFKNIIQYLPYLVNFSTKNKPEMVYQKQPGSNKQFIFIKPDEHILPIDLTNNSNDSFSYYVSSILSSDNFNTICSYIFESKQAIYFDTSENSMLKILNANDLESIGQIIEDNGKSYLNIFNLGKKLFRREEFKFHERGHVANEAFFYEAELLQQKICSDHIINGKILRAHTMTAKPNKVLDIEKEIDKLTEELKANETAQLYLQRASLFERKRFLKRAISDYEKIILFDRNNYQANFGLARIYLQIDLESFLSHIEFMNINFPDKSEHLVLSADHYQSVGKFEMTEEIFKELTKREEISKGYFHFRLGQVLRMQKKNQDAITAQSTSIKEEPLNEQSYYERAGLYMENNQFGEAIKDLTNLIQRNNTKFHIDCLVKRGISLIRLGRYDDAINDFQELLKMNFRAPMVKLYLGFCYNRINDKRLESKYLSEFENEVL